MNGPPGGGDWIMTAGEREAVRVTLLDIKRKPGRPSTGKRKRMIYCTDDERERIRELLHRLRTGSGIAPE